MSITQDTHDKILKLVTDNPGIASVEIISLVFSDRSSLAGRTHLQRIRKSYRGKGMYVWAKEGRGKILWYTAEYALANNIEGIKPAKKKVCESPFASEDWANKLMNQGLAAR
jgi:hypothetical protein